MSFTGELDLPTYQKKLEIEELEIGNLKIF